MTRRKQSNPKPLKVDETWNEAEDGKKQQSDDQKLEEESASSKCSEENNTDNPSEGQESDEVEIANLEISIKSKIKTEREESGKSENHKKGKKVENSSMGQSEMIETPKRSKSRASDLGEFGEGNVSETEDRDVRRKSHRSRNVSSSRSRSPEIPRSEINGSPHSISSQQILQGLPYLHLLPPAMRNDAARLLFMPPMLPSDLSLGASTGTLSPSNHSSSLHTDKNSLSESSRGGVPGYMCKPCSIKFSSARTLEAHQTYYCSFRQDSGKDNMKEENDDDSKSELIPPSLPGSKKRERENGVEDREQAVDEPMEISEGRRSVHDLNDINPNKIVKTGKLYSCMYCSYSADKKVSLNRHMRMHSGTSLQTSNSNEEPSGGGSGSTTPNNLIPGSNIGMNKNLPEGVNAMERYCQDCDIQFSSIKTFRVHKQYYCRTRHVLKAQVASTSTGSPTPISKDIGGVSVTPVRKTSGSPVPSECSPVSTPGPMSSQPYVVLPTNPMIIVPYCYVQAGSILTGVLPSHNALVVLPNGTVQGLPCTSIPMPIPSPSPKPQTSSLMHSNFSVCSSVKNNGISGVQGTGHGGNSSSVSPSSQSHSVFNDPKDIIRKISSISKTSSRNTDTVSSESGESGGGGGGGYKSTTAGTSQNNSSSHESTEGESGLVFKEKAESFLSDENLVYEHLDKISATGPGSDENVPAIDLTLRRAYSKKELSGDDEKENREVCLRLQNSEEQTYDSHISDANLSKRLPISSEFHREREPSSPCERLSIGSGSCGKRTPRPSSTSISSSCSTPPALLCEPKINGMISRLSPVVLDHEEEIASVNSRNYSTIAMMMSSSPNFGEILHKKGSARFDITKHKGSNFVDSRSKRGKMSPIETQLPGGAILTTTNNLTLAEILVSDSPELNETLTKLNPQILINAAQSGSPIGLNPVLLQALSQADPEMVMRMFDPLYLSNLQQSIQQQQQQTQIQQTTIKRGYSKCIECDIVFYKHENYVVHKEHYCAARMGNSSASTKPNDSDNPSHRSRKDNPTGFSRISSCSSPAKSDIDGDECLPTSISYKTSSLNSQSLTTRIPRKSTDSSSSDFFPQPIYDSSLKTKSRSPQTIPTSVSISPIPSPKEGKEMSKEKQSNFPCLQCGVKFSTIDNLKAHQSFYCTKRRSETNPCDGNDSEGVKVSTEVDIEVTSNLTNSSGTQLNNKGLLRCGKCKLSIPADQLSSHSRVCLGSNSSIHNTSNSTTGLLGNGGESRNVGWKCPCCETYSPTVSAAQKHLEVHSGIRAFKCLLCGYRGNTLRGMRTHIRTHFDKRVADLLEGEYMTCITAKELDNATTPVNRSLGPGSENRNSNINQGSRKAINRSPIERNKLNHSNSPNVITILPIESQESADVKLFSIEGNGGSVTDADKLDNNNRLNHCNLCNYSSSYRTHVIRHMKLVHKITEESTDKIINEMNLKKTNSAAGEDLDDSKELIGRKLQKCTESTESSEDIMAKDSPRSESVSKRKDVNGIDDKDRKSESETHERTGRSSSMEEDNNIGGLSSLQKKEKPCAVKYCKSCNIYFNHSSTYNAHKKSLCSGLNNETVERAETPVQ